MNFLIDYLTNFSEKYNTVQISSRYSLDACRHSVQNHPCTRLMPRHVNTKRQGDHNFERRPVWLQNFVCNMTGRTQTDVA
jgi:hypothetical protein